MSQEEVTEYFLKESVKQKNLEMAQFAARVNNFLMTLTVKGDSVLVVADLMIQATELHKRLSNED